MSLSVVDAAEANHWPEPSARQWWFEFMLLLSLFFLVAGVAPPGINEAHYLIKSKNYWDPTWCARDLFAASANPHRLFHLTFGALTQWFSLEAAAWLGRVIGWSLIAAGLIRLTRCYTSNPFASFWGAVIWIGATSACNLAGEWVIGGIEGKVPAYGLLLFALAWAIEGRWHRVWPTLGLVSGFHVLVGGWSTLILLCIYWSSGRTQQPFRRQWWPLLLGGAISLTGVLPAIQLTWGSDPEISAQAARIYSFQRLTHHLLPSALLPYWYLRHSILILLTAVLLGSQRHQPPLRRLSLFVLGCVLIAVVGLGIGLLPPVAPELSAKLLKFYWFRMTDSMVPLVLGMAVLTIAFRSTAFAQGRGESERLAGAVPGRLATGVIAIRKPLIMVICGLSLVACANEAWFANDNTVRTTGGQVVSSLGMNTTRENRQQVLSDWIAVCDWVREALPPDELLLTPRNQQTFKWYSERAEVVNWKDVPQDAASLIEWRSRFYEIFPLRLGTVRTTVRYPDLLKFKQQYNVRFMIVDHRYLAGSVPLVRVYPLEPLQQNQTYSVYRLP